MIRAGVTVPGDTHKMIPDRAKCGGENARLVEICQMTTRLVVQNRANVRRAEAVGDFHLHVLYTRVGHSLTSPWQSKGFSSSQILILVIDCPPCTTKRRAMADDSIHGNDHNGRVRNYNTRKREYFGSIRSRGTHKSRREREFE